jgi:hypothetical protein
LDFWSHFGIRDVIPFRACDHLRWVYSKMSFFSFKMNQTPDVLETFKYNTRIVVGKVGKVGGGRRSPHWNPETHKIQYQNPGSKIPVPKNVPVLQAILTYCSRRVLKGIFLRLFVGSFEVFLTGFLCFSCGFLRVRIVKSLTRVFFLIFWGFCGGQSLSQW